MMLVMTVSPKDNHHLSSVCILYPKHLHWTPLVVFCSQVTCCSHFLIMTNDHPVMLIIIVVIGNTFKNISPNSLMVSFKGLSQISSGARTASKICYLSHVIFLTVRAPGVICESPFKCCVHGCYLC